MYNLTIQRFLNLMRLLDVMSAEPVFQLKYLEWQQYPDPVGAMGELFEDLQGYESLVEEMREEGNLLEEEENLFRQLLLLSELLDDEPNAYTRTSINNGKHWREMRDVAMVLKLSLSAMAARRPGFFQ